MAFSAKVQKFIDVYAGNGVEACRAAGYKGNPRVLSTQSARLLAKADVKAAIGKREKAEARALIATRQERQQFWTEVMHDESEGLSERLKASELLGRSEADFTNKLEVKGELTLRELVTESHDKPVPVAAPRPVVPKPEST